MTPESASDFLAGEGLDESALVALINSEGRKSYALGQLLSLGTLVGTNWDWDRHPLDGWYSGVELRNAPDWAVKVFGKLDSGIHDKLADELTDARKRDGE